MSRRRMMKPQKRQTRAKILNLLVANDSARGSNFPPWPNTLNLPLPLAAIHRERLVVFRFKIDSALGSRIDEVLPLCKLLQAFRAEHACFLHVKPGSLRLEFLIFDLELTQMVAGHETI